jgi:hypothetical protein
MGEISMAKAMMLPWRSFTFDKSNIEQFAKIFYPDIVVGACPYSGQAFELARGG